MKRIKGKNRILLPEKVSTSKFANFRDKVNKLSGSLVPVGPPNSNWFNVYGNQETSPDSRKDSEISVKNSNLGHRAIKSNRHIRRRKGESNLVTTIKGKSVKCHSVDLYNKIQNFKVPSTKIRVQPGLFKDCKKRIDIISEFISNHKKNKSIEDLLSKHYYEQKIIEHRRRDSIDLKSNLINFLI